MKGPHWNEMFIQRVFPNWCDNWGSQTKSSVAMMARVCASSLPTSMCTASTATTSKAAHTSAHPSENEWRLLLHFWCVLFAPSQKHGRAVRAVFQSLDGKSETLPAHGLSLQCDSACRAHRLVMFAEGKLLCFGQSVLVGQSEENCLAQV